MKTNRNYYSWSQHSLFKSSALQFYKRYVLGEEGPRLPQFAKGKEFADYRETGEIPHWIEDPLLEAVSRAIPRLDTPEKEVRVELGHINLLAFIDESMDNCSQFHEYKTGKIPWTQTKVDAHKQLDFYALCLYILSGEKIVPKCTLYWIETEEVELRGDKVLMYTGHVESFTREFTIEDIENIGVSIMTTCQEIEDFVYEEIPLEHGIVNRYIKLLEESKKIKNELDIIKLKVLDDLNSYGAKYAADEYGRFSISQRKSPIYSAELITKKHTYDNEIKALQQSEKDSPECKYTITESLLFKAIK